MHELGDMKASWTVPNPVDACLFFKQINRIAAVPDAEQILHLQFCADRFRLHVVSCGPKDGLNDYGLFDQSLVSSLLTSFKRLNIGQ